MTSSLRGNIPLQTIWNAGATVGGRKSRTRLQMEKQFANINTTVLCDHLVDVQHEMSLRTMSRLLLGISFIVNKKTTRVYGNVMDLLERIHRELGTNQTRHIDLPITTPNIRKITLCDNPFMMNYAFTNPRLPLLENDRFVFPSPVNSIITVREDTITLPSSTSNIMQPIQVISSRENEDEQWLEGIDFHQQQQITTQHNGIEITMDQPHGSSSSSSTRIPLHQQQLDEPVLTSMEENDHAYNMENSEEWKSLMMDAQLDLGQDASDDVDEERLNRHDIDIPQLVPSISPPLQEHTSYHGDPIEQQEQQQQEEIGEDQMDFDIFDISNSDRPLAARPTRLTAPLSTDYIMNDVQQSSYLDSQLVMPPPQASPTSSIQTDAYSRILLDSLPSDLPGSPTGRRRHRRITRLDRDEIVLPVAVYDATDRILMHDNHSRPLIRKQELIRRYRQQLYLPQIQTNTIINKVVQQARGRFGNNSNVRGEVEIGRQMEQGRNQEPHDDYLPHGLDIDDGIVTDRLRTSRDNISGSPLRIISPDFQFELEDDKRSSHTGSSLFRQKQQQQQQQGISGMFSHFLRQPWYPPSSLDHEELNYPVDSFDDDDGEELNYGDYLEMNVDYQPQETTNLSNANDFYTYLELFTSDQQRTCFFQDLFISGENKRSEVALAFYLVLVLATQGNRLYPEQTKPYGPLLLRLL
ncbi:uncharacterized protein BX664DRAFT_343389 [Halteromyces radiatus]|uniref:uncharacterized protein n=1 Tax=Halteromyces radiatus TaxID=101107 RepID=UPI00221FEE31|nr:uncharacterized protein BX664DRAFT_343389 [Halteromyces radiatus]KAI8077748.1 hypothetical protein BX664DRAFT_343389 [Halteromyces radiatus]